MAPIKPTERLEQEVITVRSTLDHRGNLYAGRCTCGYRSADYSYPGYAERATAQHARDKHGASS